MSKKVAFQGVAGAYSEQAAREFFGPDTEVTPCKTFRAMFEAVTQHDADIGMLPVENATAGTVARSYELLMEYDLRIQAEHILHVHHALLANPDTERDAIRRVKSHRQALAQCEGYLRRHRLAVEQSFDTAGAARDLAANPEPDLAVIASALAAERYGLTMLEEEIEDLPFNYTRFFAIGHEDPTRTERHKTSVVFAVRHQPAALYDCLSEFARRNVNLTKIESRPRGNRPWEYLFYLDFEGYWKDPAAEKALIGLLRRASFVKILGSYPAAYLPFAPGGAWSDPGSD